jgi:hypothetical protein
VVFACVVFPAWAGSIGYDITASASGSAGGYSDPTPYSGYQSFSTAGIVPGADFLGPPLQVSGTTTYIETGVGAGNDTYTNSASALVQYAINDGQLESYVNAAAGTADPLGDASAYGSAYLLIIDTVSIGGLPVGTPVYVELLPFLHSILTAACCGTLSPTNGVILDAGLSDTNTHLPFYSPGLNLSLTNTVGSPGSDDQSTSGIMEVLSGDELTVEIQMINNASVSQQGDVTSSALDTGFTYLEVLTPGATITSELGIDYAPTSSVPEPSTFFLILSALAIGVLYKCQPLPKSRPASHPGSRVADNPGIISKRH